MGRKGNWSVMSTGFLFGVVKTLENGCWWLHNIVNMLKTPELYNLIGWILWYVNYSSKLLKKSMDLQAPFLEILLSLWLTPNLYFKQLPWWSQCSKRLGWADGGGSLMYLETSPESYLSYIWRKRCQQRRFKMSNAARKAATVQVPRRKTTLTSPEQMAQVPCRPSPPSSAAAPTAPPSPKPDIPTAHPDWPQDTQGAPPQKAEWRACLWALGFGLCPPHFSKTRTLTCGG